MGLEQRHRPSGGLIAEVIRRLVQRAAEDRLGIFGPFRGATGAIMGDQGTRDGMVPIGIDPTVDRAPTDPEPDGHIGDRTPPVEFQQREGATVGIEVVGRPELSAEAKPLLGSQLDGVHGSPPGQDNHGEPKGARMDISWSYPRNGARSRKNGWKTRSERR